jgi:hypothetical protein
MKFVSEVDCFWNVMAHAQKPDFVFRRNGRVNLNRRKLQFSRLLAAEVCVSAVVMLDTPCAEVVWRLLATHSIRPVSPLHFPSLRHLVPSHFNWSLTTCHYIQHFTRRDWHIERWICTKLNTIYKGADKFLDRPGRKQARKHVRDARDFNNIETRAVIKFSYPQGKALKEINAILTETLSCFTSVCAKDLSATLY